MSQASGTSAPESTEDEQPFSTVGEKKRKKNQRSSTQTKKLNDTKSPEIRMNPPLLPPPQKNPQNKVTNTTSNNSQKKTINNHSQQMFHKINRKYQHGFYVSTTTDLPRTQMADIWMNHFPRSKDTILKTKKGFLIKSDGDKENIVKILQLLKNNKTINSFEENKEMNSTSQGFSTQGSYSVVISSVDPDITDEEISTELKNQKIEHRFCKRITSRATGKPTQLIRIITGNIKAFECLLAAGLFYKCRHYPVFPSTPPEPIPVPCARCNEFTHTTINCKSVTICNKCKGNHHTNSCTSPLPISCTACGEKDHVAWSIKCPKRPTKPIDGIPNVKIKSINKKSHQIKPSITKNNRVHTPITIHDNIIDTYIQKLNNPKNTDRQQLINKLKMRFIEAHNIDTTAVFSGNRLYILMFDLNEENSVVATEPIEGTQILATNDNTTPGPSRSIQ